MSSQNKKDLTEVVLRAAKVRAKRKNKTTPTYRQIQKTVNVYVEMFGFEKAKERLYQHYNINQ